jgi:hypothetical protein
MMNQFNIFNKGPYDSGIKDEMMWDEGSVGGFGGRYTVGWPDFG